MIFTKGGNASARLAEALNVPLAIPAQYSKRAWRGLISQESQTRPINYGLRCDWVEMPSNTININAQNAGSKPAVFRVLTERGIPCPQLVEPGHDKPFIARMDYRSQGRGMRVFEAGARPRKQYDFYVEIIPFGREYRVHVIGGQVAIVSRKIVPDDYTHVMKTHRLGCRVQPARKFKLSPVVAKYCIDAVAALNLDFAAVDVYEDPDGRPYILELNTAPGIEFGRILNAYVAALTPLIHKETP